MKLNTAQLKILAEILAKIAVAWFSAGVISPFFLMPKRGIELIFPFVVGLGMAIFFAALAMIVVKDIKND